MIFTVSCKTKIICQQVESTKIKPIILSEVSFEFMRCRIRCFDFNEWKELDMKQCKGFESLTDEKSINLPIEACDGIAGFSNEDMAIEVKPKIKKLNAIKNDVCK